MTENGTVGIGQLIARYRKQRGLTVAALSEETGDPRITTSVINNLELGRKADITVRELLAIARALSVSPTYLLADSRDPFGAAVSMPGGELTNYDLASLLARHPSPKLGDWLQQPLENDGFAAIRELLEAYYETQELAAGYAELIGSVDESVIRKRLSAELGSHQRSIMAMRAQLAEKGVTLSDRYSAPTVDEVLAKARGIAAGKTRSKD